MTKQKWLILGITIPTILGLVGLGFAAMSTNPPFAVPAWLPMFFFVLAGLMIIALATYLMWEVIIRLRIQSPIIVINQRGKTNIVSAMMTIKQPPPRRLHHDGILWEDGGRGSWGHIHVIGPLCPKDFTPLTQKHGDKIDTDIHEDTLISNSGYHTQLVCPECNAEYVLGAKPKSIKDSRNEVSNRFEGMRRREQEAQES